MSNTTETLLFRALVNAECTVDTTKAALEDAQRRRDMLKRRVTTLRKVVQILEEGGVSDSARTIEAG